MRVNGHSTLLFMRSFYLLSMHVSILCTISHYFVKHDQLTQTNVRHPLTLTLELLLPTY